MVLTQPAYAILKLEHFMIFHFEICITNYRVKTQEAPDQALRSAGVLGKS